MNSYPCAFMIVVAAPLLAEIPGGVRVPVIVQDV
jgi:hypothetical protein